ncbi:MAG TPA: peptidoglycan-binding domain-containing protein [Paracoccaceae bacterium]|nr:peptidoglycan-binding domain-containing protein [Paracoccaceae bacterium]
MTFRRIATGVVALSLTVVPAGQAAADNAVVGGIVGGIIGGIIVNEANKNRNKRTTTRTTTRSTSGQTAAVREANREVQTALNYFGFPVGTPDGALGPKSRAAIADYQVFMGYPPTGNLNTFERDHLVASYYRAQSGGAMTAQQVAGNPMGVRGLLHVYRDERIGVPGAATFAGGAMAGAGGGMALGGGMPFAGAAAPVAPVAAPVLPAAPAAAPAMPTFAAPAPAAPALPSFLAGGAAAVSLSSHCAKVAVVTNSNGGYMTQVNMTDPGLALAEQFCLARTYGIAQGEELSARIQGFTPQQIAEQCAGFGPVLKDQVASVSVKSMPEVMQAMQSFVLNSGMAPAQMGGTARVCLGAGYVADDMDVAMGSALILTALGEKAYGEVVGHHLVSGIGAAQRPDLALPWFDAALGTPGVEVPSPFAPGMADRAGLVRMAAYAAAGQPQPGGSVPGMVQPAQAPAGIQLPKLNLPFFGAAPKAP